MSNFFHFTVALLTNPHRKWRKCPLYPCCTYPRYAYFSLLYCIKIQPHQLLYALLLLTLWVQCYKSFAVTMLLIKSAAFHMSTFYSTLPWLKSFVLQFIFDHFNECHSTSIQCKLIQFI